MKGRNTATRGLMELDPEGTDLARHSEWWRSGNAGLTASQAGSSPVHSATKSTLPGGAPRRNLPSRSWDVLSSVLGAALFASTCVPAQAQERLALVVPAADSAELASAYERLQKAQVAFDEASKRIEKKLVPESWPCCSYEWSTGFRVLFPRISGGLSFPGPSTNLIWTNNSHAAILPPVLPPGSTHAVVRLPRQIQ